MQAEYGNQGEESQIVAARVASPVARAAPIAITRSNMEGPLPTFR